MCSTEHQKNLLRDAVVNFIEEHKLSCGEDVWDIDKWDCHSLPFIDDLCKIVGYYEYEESE